MHFMMIGIVLHATLLGVIAFFVLFAASKADGIVKLFGNILGVWILLILIGSVVFGGWQVMHGGTDFDRLHRGWMWHGPMMAPPGYVPPTAAPQSTPAPAPKR